MWNVEERSRAPVGDLPPVWADSWGGDSYGLWADLVVKGASQRMRWIEPSGSKGFFMGSSQSERDAILEDDVRGWANKNEHEVGRETVDAGFWLADTPCTQDFWTAVVGYNASNFREWNGAGELPVESVSWDDVMELFVRRLTRGSDFSSGSQICLPSDKQWEYAARAGTRTAYWWGDKPDDEMANWNKLRNGTTPVKKFSPNPWGLFDVHGNVWEWCSDIWRSFRESPARQEEDFRVVRGGSWIDRAGSCRAAFRFGGDRRFAYRGRGFRFAIGHDLLPALGL